jgi:acetyl esterase
MTDYDDLRQERLARISEKERAVIASWPDLAAIGVDAVRTLIESANSSVAVTPGVRTRDVMVDAPDGPVPVRIYIPPHDEHTTLPVVVHTHSGGFVAGGGLDQWDGMNTFIAQTVPAIVVHPDFRLPPENRFPAGLRDAWAVLNWVSAGGGELEQWDTSRIAVGGGCTGGNMAAVLSLLARDEGGPDLSLQFLESWPSDLRGDTRSQLENAEGYGLRKSDNDFVAAQYLREPEDRWDWRASPLLASSLRGVAPALITVGNWDVLRDEDIQYADRLKDAGVPVELHVDEDRGHIATDRQAALERLCDAIRRAFSGEFGR